MQLAELLVERGLVGAGPGRSPAEPDAGSTRPGRAARCWRCRRRLAQPTCPPPPRDTYAEAKRPDQVVLTWKSGSDPAPPHELYAVYRDGVRDRARPASRGSWTSGCSRAPPTSTSCGRSAPEARAPTRPPARITTPAVARVRDRPLPPAAHARPARTSCGRPTSLPPPRSRFGPAGGAAGGRRARPAADAAATSCRCRNLRPARRTSTAGSRTASSATPARFTTPPAAPRRLLFRRDRRLRRSARRPRARTCAACSQDPRCDFAITTGDNAQIYGTEEEYREFVLGPAARPDRDEAVLAERRQPRLLQPPELPALLRAAERRRCYYSFTYGGVLFLSLDSNRFDAAPAAVAARRAGRLTGALQGRLLPSPAVVERPRIPQPRPPSAARAVRADPPARRRGPGAQRPRAELRALEAAALRAAQPARASSTS